jgi:hypothetical protein
MPHALTDVPAIGAAPLFSTSRASEFSRLRALQMQPNESSMSGRRDQI